VVFLCFYLKAKVEMLDNLKEIECAYNLLKSSAGGASLKTKIEPLERSSEEWDLINQYTTNTHGKTHSSYSLDVDEVWTDAVWVKSLLELSAL